MRELATLKLDRGEELRVEVDTDDLGAEEIMVHRAADNARATNGDFLAVLKDHLAHAKPHPAGTTDRLLEADRRRPY
jgi:hypothetical protein